MLRRVALAAFALSGATLSAQTAVSDGVHCWLVRKGAAVRIEGPSDAQPLSVSADGRWLVTGVSLPNGIYRLSLSDTSSPVQSSFPLGFDGSPPSWSPDNRRFVVQGGAQGLRIVDLSGSDPLVTEIAEAGHCPAWSPNGGRIVYGTGTGVAVSNESGSNPKTVSGAPKADRIAWSPDGQAILVASPAGKGLWKLTILGMAKSATKEIGETDNLGFDWSPNGQRVLARKAGVWGFYETASAKWHPSPGLAANSAAWAGSSTLVGIKSGSLVRWETGTDRATPFFDAPPKGLPEVNLKSFSACQGIVVEGSKKSPFGQLSNPQPGQILVTGTTEEIDFENGLLKVEVFSVRTPDGMELNLAKPIAQTVVLTNESKRPTAKGPAPLRIADFVQQGEIALTLVGQKAGVAQPLVVLVGVVPELAVEGSSVPVTTADRPGRMLEYGGVSMDTVVVDLLFPVCGKVSWSDTFLASRGGGSRRHHGQDLMAPKMRPLVAVSDGVVRFNTSKANHNTITLRGDGGWTVVYMHVNNDNPGTDDGKGGPRFAFAAGLKSGDRVTRGQLVGYCGDSGNAESTGPHCHFELHDEVSGGVLNAAPTLEDSPHLEVPVAIDPCPTVVPSAGETRWDLLVTKVDSERRVLVAELLSEAGPHPLTTNVSPRLVYVRLGEKTSVALREKPENKLSFEDFKVGSFVTALGPTPAADQALDASRLFLGESIRK